MAKRIFKVWRGNLEGGDFQQYDTDVDPGMVVLDVLHRIQAQQANDLALRWNCKAGKCGSCSMEINGKPRLACMTRMNSFSEDATITCQDRKSTRLNSSHLVISYAVFCLKKKKKTET